MSEPIESVDEWDACPAGELNRVVRRLRSQRRDLKTAKFVASGGALVCVIVLGLMFARHQHDAVCADVQSKLNGYIAGDLNPDVSESIRRHLEICPKCESAYRHLTAGVSGVSLPCNCPHCVAARRNLPDDSSLATASFAGKSGQAAP